MLLFPQLSFYVTNKTTFMYFYQPSGQLMQSLKHEMYRLESKFKKSPDIDIKLINCQSHYITCKKIMKLNTLPHFFYFQNHTLTEYMGYKDAESMEEYINKEINNTEVFPKTIFRGNSTVRDRYVKTGACVISATMPQKFGFRIRQIFAEVSKNPRVIFIHDYIDEIPEEFYDVRIRNIHTRLNATNFYSPLQTQIVCDKFDQSDLDYIKSVQSTPPTVPLPGIDERNFELSKYFINKYLHASIHDITEDHKWVVHDIITNEHQPLILDYLSTQAIILQAILKYRISLQTPQ